MGVHSKALSLISSRIRFIPFSEFEDSIPQEKELCADQNDVEYLALALTKMIQIWSDDKDFRKQSITRVYSTTELLQELDLC